ncbi:MAG: thiamine-phosphate kinase [Novosphingobium sp. 28-62-57]|uniref:thiamine-phosphate kinase n=1 Tax=unclassified Novosphingobium TaxID=2644732 RepID=UPI000BCBCD00|nr:MULTISPECIES: thiamine-phosphate kinase [unclassified Novosphingobium]OYW50779.1 MAG: thiamine-phosphate kinase [Novosphingobium sp. 12-62-10]OYZ10083.1 MAG: thiamine-phosphate kinase [Novosphingobium sp. 28-62-57]OYZ98644.1 MAG: thiamine-phosphate kinase [Novosphingobium sp. 17-62-8]HQS71508.1 thiamine-phosphate kinase [Novosphingobium sp.]
MSKETALIAALRSIAPHPAARGLQDDCAVLDFGGETLILTHDMMVEGVHWLPGQDMADVAWKLVATNLSDLAAKGAEPIGVLLGFTLGDDDTRFLAGLEEALTAFAVPLLGGDTVSATGPRTLGLTALGRATSRSVPDRRGASAGDTLWLTGPVGAAMLGFEALRDRTSADSTAFRRPTPRLPEGRALAPFATAMMDVSDGLLIDAARMAQASGVTFAITSASVPFPPSLPPECQDDAMRWGDDYELLFTLPSGIEPPISAHCIGTANAPTASPVIVDGAVLHGSLGYTHD